MDIRTHRRRGVKRWMSAPNPFDFVYNGAQGNSSVYILEDKMNHIALSTRWQKFCMAVIIAIVMSLTGAPAQACACGIYLPQEGEASVSEEHVLIRWDGQTEDIVMTLGVLGSSKEAAVILPVPARGTVQLADPEVFDALRELTKPDVEDVYQIFPVVPGLGGAGAASPVQLLERQTLGPFDVSTLAASDSNALGGWLAENGYNLPPEIAASLEPYVAENWYFIAVRLSPGAGSEELSGKLDPLWITFPYDKIVYPMRPTALARDQITVYMYILADHRVQKPMSFGSEDVQYADWVDPAALQPDSPLAPFVHKRLFLTKIVESIWDPKAITDDYVFEFASADTIYHQVVYRHVYDIAGIPLFLLIPCCFVLVIALSIFGIVMAVRRFAKPKPI